MTERLLDLPVKIFADGADLQGIAELSPALYPWPDDKSDSDAKSRSDPLRKLCQSSLERSEI